MTKPTQEQIDAALLAVKNLVLYGDKNNQPVYEILKTAIASLQAEVERKDAAIKRVLSASEADWGIGKAFDILRAALAPAAAPEKCIEETECKECFGEKKVWIAGYKISCPTCNGTGHAPATDEVK